MGDYDYPLNLSDLDLYCGPDIENAFARSVVLRARNKTSNNRAVTGCVPLGIDRLARDALSITGSDWRPMNCVIGGIEAASGKSMRILFRGRNRSLEFCSRHILGSDHYVVEPAHDSMRERYDVVVTDRPWVPQTFRSFPMIAAEPWIRQRCEIADTWQLTLERRPRSLRKELRRALRKRRITVALENDPGVMHRFYEQVLIPYIEERFGDNAVMKSKRAFMRESRTAALLTLYLDGQLSAGSVIRIENDALLVEKSALHLAHDTPSRSELLDYFCLLLAQKLGMRWLDLGLSRPNIDDGVFRYKSKWRPQLCSGPALKSPIRIQFMNGGAATLGFLGRNGFIERRRSRFVVRRLHFQPLDARSTDALDALGKRTGVHEVIVGLASSTTPLTSFDSRHATDRPGNVRASCVALRPLVGSRLSGSQSLVDEFLYHA